MEAAPPRPRRRSSQMNAELFRPCRMRHSLSHLSVSLGPSSFPELPRHRWSSGGRGNLFEEPRLREKRVADQAHTRRRQSRVLAPTAGPDWFVSSLGGVLIPDSFISRGGGRGEQEVQPPWRRRECDTEIRLRRPVSLFRNKALHGESSAALSVFLPLLFSVHSLFSSSHVPFYSSLFSPSPPLVWPDAAASFFLLWLG